MEDWFGTCYNLTGHEGSGKCFWCGGDFPDKRPRRYCSENCQQEYYRHFLWPSASAWCIERAGGKCVECGKRSSCEAHHIIPLNGAYRFATRANLPENLACLCHSCHREKRIKTPRDGFDLAKAKGQLFFEALV